MAKDTMTAPSVRWCSYCPVCLPTRFGGGASSRTRSSKSMSTLPLVVPAVLPHGYQAVTTDDRIDWRRKPWTRPTEKRLPAC
jgi:hypothetical protein